MTREAIRSLQTGLSGLGHNPGPIDGLRGRLTEGAVEDLAVSWGIIKAPPKLMIEPPSVEAPISGVRGVFNVPSQRLLGFTHPDLQKLMTAAREEKIFDIIESVRSIERQREMVKKGLSKTMNSRHLASADGKSRAVDIWPIDPETQKRVTSKDPKELDRLLWKYLREIADVVKRKSRELNIPVEWGGDWGWDAPHFQLPRSVYP